MSTTPLIACQRIRVRCGPSQSQSPEASITAVTVARRRSARASRPLAPRQVLGRSRRIRCRVTRLRCRRWTTTSPTNSRPSARCKVRTGSSSNDAAVAASSPRWTSHRANACRADVREPALAMPHRRCEGRGRGSGRTLAGPWTGGQPRQGSRPSPTPSSNQTALPPLNVSTPNSLRLLGHDREAAPAGRQHGVGASRRRGLAPVDHTHPYDAAGGVAHHGHRQFRTRMQDGVGDQLAGEQRGLVAEPLQAPLVKQQQHEVACPPRAPRH